MTVAFGSRSVPEAPEARATAVPRATAEAPARPRNDRRESGGWGGCRPIGGPPFGRPREGRGRHESRVRPGLAILVVEQVVGLVVVGEPLGMGVPVEPRLGRERDVGQEGEGRRAMA